MKPQHAPRHVEVVVLVAERAHPVLLRKARDPLGEELRSVTSAGAGRSSPAPRTHWSC
jgi:hypothetical protein